MQFSLPNRVGCKKLLSGRGCGPAGFNKKQIQASQPVKVGKIMYQHSSALSHRHVSELILYRCSMNL